MARGRWDWGWSIRALLASDTEAHVGQDLEALDRDRGSAVFAGSVGAVCQTTSGSVDFFEHALDRGGLRVLQASVLMWRGLLDRPELGDAGVALVFQTLECLVLGELLDAAHVGGHVNRSFQADGKWEAGVRSEVTCVRRLPESPVLRLVKWFYVHHRRCRDRRPLGLTPISGVWMAAGGGWQMSARPDRRAEGEQTGWMA